MKLEKIKNNFKIYDKFLSPLNKENRNILISLKMMYSIHMENIQADRNIFFVIKQMLRCILKVFTIPFYINKLRFFGEKSTIAILENSEIEKYISREINIPIITIKMKICLNIKFLVIYRKLFKMIYILLKNKTLKIDYSISLIHRLIDYLMVYETVNIDNLEVLLIENDRLPSNLAMIHLLRSSKRKTIKYDNWLIDPINHNDVYCDYYYYPSIYHKNIIESFSNNKDLIYVKGGFLYWDKLNKYKANLNKSIINIVYFTQFGVPIDVHFKYISDIIDVLEVLNINYNLIVKIHPREDIDKYNKFNNISSSIQVIDISTDIYTLISESNFCFSIFSTISLEAKHILDNSYFINYNSNDFDIINYDKINLDIIKNKDMLYDLFNNKQKAGLKAKVIKKINCNFPNSCQSLKLFIDKELSSY